MIEKPKRPKQPDIQERQPPRTLQEIVNRYDLDNTKIYDYLDSLVNNINKQMSEGMYPVGSIYMSVNNVNPSTFFGGTWIEWGAGKVPVGVDTNDSDFDTVEDSGGSKSESYTPQGSNAEVTLTGAQSGMPAHGHSFTQPTVNGGSCTITSSGGHSHQIKAEKIGASGSARAIVSGSGAFTYSAISGDGSHTHTVPNHTHSVSGGAVSDASAKNATSPHNHAFTGTEANISHLQPYITCYMWKRTA